MKTGFERMDNAQLCERVDLILLYMYDYGKATNKLIPRLSLKGWLQTSWNVQGGPQVMLF